MSASFETASHPAWGARERSAPGRPAVADARPPANVTWSSAARAVQGRCEPGYRFNVAGLDFSSIRLALLCAETGSLSRAARLANMSLSCASRRLSILEDLLRARLFQRNYQGLMVTEAGAIFVAYARAMLDALGSMRRQLDDLPHDASTASEYHTAATQHVRA